MFYGDFIFTKAAPRHATTSVTADLKRSTHSYRISD